MSRFTLLLGGDLVRTPRLDAQIAGTRIIAADSGMRHAATLGVMPELWIGDFDSAPAGLPQHLLTVEKRVFPPAKDSTDGELAVAEALARGATALVLAGAFGGPRADHAFLHLTMAIQLAEAGRPVVLTSGSQEGAPLLPGATSFDYADGVLFSVLAFTYLSGLTIRGARWPLDAIELPFGSSLTISNVVEGELTVQLDAGRAILLAHPYPGPDQ
jgi:thiamine pyrophosphokinase